MTSRGGWALGLAAVMALGAVNFLWGLGSSSLFVDEAGSWARSIAPLGDLYSLVRDFESSPPGYFAFLHEWIYRVGSESETSMRLPSALAGIGTVGATFWVATRLADRRVGLLAALLVAISPLVLEYAQQARGYALAMLATTVAVGAGLELERTPEGRARAAWTAVLALAVASALALHYSTALVTVPLIALLVRRGKLPRPSLFWTGGALGLTALALAPLAIEQLTRPEATSGIAEVAGFGSRSLTDVLATPFDGRPTDELGIGALMMVAAALYACRSEHFAGSDVRSLALPLAAAAPIALAVVSLLGGDVLISRYSAIAAPLMLIVLAAAILRAPRAVGIAGAVVAVALAGALSIKSHRDEGLFPDVRRAVEVIRTGAAPPRHLIVAGYPEGGPVVQYYARRSGIEGLRVVPSGLPSEVARAVRSRDSVWLLRDPSKRLPPGTNVRRIAVLEGARSLLVLEELRRRRARAERGS